MPDESPLVAVALTDRVDMRGGRAYFLDAEGILWVQVVRRELERETGVERYLEKRYRFDGRAAAFRRIAEASADAEALRSDARVAPGGRVRDLWLRWGSGRTACFPASGSGASAAWSALVGELTAAASPESPDPYEGPMPPRSADLPPGPEPAHEGDYDPAWRPEGFRGWTTSPADRPGPPPSLDEVR